MKDNKMRTNNNITIKDSEINLEFVPTHSAIEGIIKDMKEVVSSVKEMKGNQSQMVTSLAAKFTITEKEIKCNNFTDPPPSHSSLSTVKMFVNIKPSLMKHEHESQILLALKEKFRRRKRRIKSRKEIKKTG